jgi:2-hydroxychromene-2-carboxylate isomerase
LALPPEVRFYYGLGSRYSYLASTQIERLAAETGCRVRWRPLYSGDLFAARGTDPFAGPPLSGQYDWAYRRADAEAWADYYDVPYREPDDVRCDPRRLALACTAAARLGAVEAFSHLCSRRFSSLAPRPSTTRPAFGSRVRSGSIRRPSRRHSTIGRPRPHSRRP